MKQLVAAFSNYDAPTNGLGCFDVLFDYGRDAKYLTSLSDVDALILWGGADISPSLYKEDPIPYSGPKQPSERDLFEWELIKEAVAYGIPILGVCRGAQLLCTFAGGSLIQDVNNHQTPHAIATNDGKSFLVNSYHHQMMYPYNVEHELLAWTTKKQATSFRPATETASNMGKPCFDEAEVVYFPEVGGLAIQCHPEWMPKSNPFNEWVIDKFVSLFFKECV